VLIGGCNSNAVVTEERLELTTTGEDISCESEKILEQYKLSLTTLQFLVTDGSPAMINFRMMPWGERMRNLEVKLMLFITQFTKVLCTTIIILSDDLND
jgi:hypothetical protein